MRHASRVIESERKRTSTTATMSKETHVPRPWDARRLLGLRATEQGASAMENA
jgi:hypothetical protein